MANKAKIILESDNRVKRGIKTLLTSIKKVHKASLKATRVLKRMAGGALSAFKKVGAAGLGAAAGIAASVREAHLFARRMAEVNTMMGSADIEGFTHKVQELSAELGLTKDELAGGLYQTLSAGIPEKNAIEFLTISAKAAVAGVTEVDTAVDALTTVINSYKFEASDAQQVSDVLFQTVKLGKTTFSELAESLAKVTPIAAASGVRFEDVASAFGTLTKQGVRTAMASTQIRAAILATNEVLGDGWTKSMRLKDGFAAVAKQAGGSNTKLRELVGRVEALNGILGLTGSNAKGAAQDLAKFAGSGGSAQKAFVTMDKVREWEKAWQSFRSVMTSFGMAIKNSVAPHIRELAGWLKGIAESRGVFERLRADVEAFVDSTVPKLKVVAGLIKDIFEGGDKRTAAFSNIGRIIVAAFSDAGTILENKLIPIAQRVGYIIGNFIHDALPDRFKKGSIAPRDKLNMDHTSLGLGHKLSETQGVTHSGKAVVEMARLMKELRAAQKETKAIFSKKEVSRMEALFDRLFGPPSRGGELPAPSSGSGEKKRKRGATLVDTSFAQTAAMETAWGRASAMKTALGRSSAMKTRRNPMEKRIDKALDDFFDFGNEKVQKNFIQQGIGMGDVFTRMQGQDFSRRKREATFASDGGMNVHVVNQEMSGHRT